MALRRKAYISKEIKCYCYYEYTCHIICCWSRAFNIPCGIKHIVSDFVGELSEMEEEYVYTEIKLFVSITRDIDRLMEAWGKCNLAEINKEFGVCFCGKIGTIKDIDVDGSSEIEFANYQCYLPNSCCTILDGINDRSLISAEISSHLD